MQLEKYTAPDNINNYRDVRVDRAFAFECDKMIDEENNQQPTSNMKMRIPGRSRQVVKLQLLKSSLKEGYIPRIEVNPNVFLGECVVNNDNESCNVFIVNTSHEDVEVDIPPQQLEEFDNISDMFESSSDEEEEQITAPSKRIEKIKSILELQHLNQEEREHIYNLVYEFQDRFHLPGDPLPCTHLVEHEVHITDNVPINIKQYRQPPIHNVRNLV